jgi:preprotein translocase subunit YajC
MLDTSTMGTFHLVWLVATFFMLFVSPLFSFIMMGLAFLYFIAAHYDATKTQEHQWRMEALEEDMRIAEQTRAANDNQN